MGTKEYCMINDDDRIAVCITGSNSMLLAKCLQHLQSYSQTKFDLVFAMLDAPNVSREEVMSKAELLNIPITQTISIQENGSFLDTFFTAANEFGCNKLALDDDFDSAIEAIIMGMLYSGNIRSLMPVISDKNNTAQLIRPMCMVKAEHIRQWESYNHLAFPPRPEFVLKTENELDISKLAEAKELIANFRKTNPFIETNIYKSVYNVNLRTIVGWTQNGEKHSFLDDYDNYEFQSEADEEEQNI